MAGSLQMRTSALALSTFSHPGAAERQASYFLFLANRALADYQTKLDCGYNLIVDRYIDATIACHHELDAEGSITRLIHNRLGWPRPDLTIYLDCDVATAHQRLDCDSASQPGKFRRAKPTLEQARQNYRQIIEREPNRFCRIDGAKRPKEILEIAKKALIGRFNWTASTDTGGKSASDQ